MQKYLSEQRLKRILDRCAGLSIGVVGDLGLDAYWYADMTRSFLSRETPHFSRPVVREVYAPGAGANVADNLKALGVGMVTVLSVIGADWRGDLLRQVLTLRDVSVEDLLVSPDRSTTTYVKPMLQGYNSVQEDARLDFGNVTPLAPKLEQALIDSLTTQAFRLDALLVVDQLEVHGVVTERVREALNTLAADHRDTCFLVDSRQRIGLFRHMVLKPNWVEAAAAVLPDRNPRDVGRDELARIGMTLHERSGLPAFVTLSEAGVLVCAGDEPDVISAGPVRPPLDPVGAGDTFIAALAASLAGGATPQEAGTFANLAAAVTVEKLNQTGTATPAEIVARYEMACKQENRS